MSFKKSWQNVEQRTLAFNLGAGFDLPDLNILSEIAGRISDAKRAVLGYNPASLNLPAFTEAEEHLAAIVTDIMHLSAKNEWDIPGAMAARNTLIRAGWKQKTIDAQVAQPKTTGNETIVSQGQGTQVRSRSQGSATRTRTRSSTR